MFLENYSNIQIIIKLLFFFRWTQWKVYTVWQSLSCKCKEVNSWLLPALLSKQQRYCFNKEIFQSRWWKWPWDKQVSHFGFTYRSHFFEKGTVSTGSIRCLQFISSTSTSVIGHAWPSYDEIQRSWWDLTSFIVST